ncbi:hypothetical protein [Gordonia polyisoprenivorans]|nr:hypothetical protein [Gordonia polyisoprenivorans]
MSSDPIRPPTPPTDIDDSLKVDRFSAWVIDRATRELTPNARNRARDEWSYDLHLLTAKHTFPMQVWRTARFLTTTIPRTRTITQIASTAATPIPTSGALAATHPWSPRQVLFAMIGAVMTLTFALNSIQTWCQWLATDWATRGGGAELSDLESEVWSFIGLLALAATIPGFIAATPLRRVAGLGLPGRRRWLGFVGAAAAVMALMLATAWLHGDTSTGNAESAAWRGNSAPVLILASAHAGVVEEVTSILVPTLLALAGIVAVTFARDTLLPLIRIARGSTEPTPPDYNLPSVLTSRSTWPICIAATSVGLVGRYAGHLYQGTPYAHSALFWGLGMIALFAITRSIWPLIAGHLLHDVVTAGVMPPLSTTAWVIYLAALLVTAIVAGALCRRR